MMSNMITGSIQTNVGNIPQVATKLNYTDYLGTVKVRWSIGRNHYKVQPGLYAVGNPDGLSDVFVTANYKLSFDHVRKNLDGLNAWILVLDTKGVNVWCAAGKGIFSTRELLNRIKLTNLEQVVGHRKLILPQLGAVGVSAHQVKNGVESASSNSILTANNVQPDISFKKDTFQMKSNQGFTVIYGPVRAADIKTFVNSGYKASNEMRKVNFTFTDRIKLIPVDFVYSKWYLLSALAIVFILSGLGKSGLSLQQSFSLGFQAMLNVFLAYIAGIVITPALLPFVPVRPFALKGFLAGGVVSALLLFLNGLGNSFFEIVSWFLLISGLSSFLAMNFTGSSTYTSLSGVKKEMKVAIPFQIAFSAVGLVLFVIAKLI